ncbi:MAG: outer membrane beta-barrel protein [Saprospirales bacterium]|nr:outer membrane beta-barrel protein [Saprospirales bacterium]
MDRNLYKSDKKLMDHGWRSMQRALDRELPAERRRHPGVLLWLLALLVPIGGALAWLMWPMDGAVTTSPALQPPVAQNKAVAPAPPRSTLATTISTSDTTISAGARHTKPAHNTTPPVASKSGASSGISQGPDQQPGKNTSDLSRKPEKHNREKMENPVVPRPGALAEISQPARSKDQLATGARNTGSVPFSQAPPAERAIPATNGTSATDQAVAPMANAPAPAAPSAPPLAPAIELAPKRVSNAWSFGASAGVLSDVSAGYAGAAAGLTAEWQAGPRWGLRSGVAYQYQALHEADRPLLSISTASYAEVTGDQKVLDTNNTGSVVPSSADLIAPVYVPISRMHRLVFPVMAYWNPLSKIRLFGGVSIGANLYAESGNNSLKEKIVLPVAGGSASDQLNQRLSEQLRGWDFSWNAGIGFRPGRRISVDVFWQNPFAALSRAQAEPDQAINAGGGQESTAARLVNERANASNGRSQLQFSATLFF